MERGVPQGDPLSLSLFVLAVEIMAQYIRNCKKIKGIKVSTHNFKLLQYVDDAVGIVKDLKSAKYFFV